MSDSSPFFLLPTVALSNMTAPERILVMLLAFVPTALRVNRRLFFVLSKFIDGQPSIGGGDPTIDE